MTKLEDLLDLCKHYNRGDKHIKWTDICVAMIKLPTEQDQLLVSQIIEDGLMNSAARNEP